MATDDSSTKTSSWRAVTARSPEELEAIAEAWDALPGDEVTADREHFLTVLALRPEAVRPHVVLLERDGEPVALAAARLEELRLPARLGYRTVASPRLRALTLVPGGLLGELSEEVATRVLAELRGALARGEADVVRLRAVEVDSPLHRVVTTETPAFLRERFGNRSVRWTAALPDSYEAFLRSRKKTLRQNLRYNATRLERTYGDRLRLRTYHDGSDLESLYSEAGRVAEKTYQHALGAAFVDDELRRALVDVAVRRGWFRAYVLFVDDDPVAYWFATVYRGVVHTGFTGYDPAYRDDNVGTYVLTKLIEEACADPDATTLDHGWGDADYKRRLADRSRLEQDLFVYAPTFRGLRANAVRTGVGGASRAARRALRGRSVARVKRWWRDRLRRR